jgi:hypothetical protein
VGVAVASAGQSQALARAGKRHLNRKVGKAGKLGADYFPLFPPFLFDLPPVNREGLWIDAEIALCLGVFVVQQFAFGCGCRLVILPG